MVAGVRPPVRRAAVATALAISATLVAQAPSASAVFTYTVNINDLLQYPTFVGGSLAGLVNGLGLSVSYYKPGSPPTITIPINVNQIVPLPPPPQSQLVALDVKINTFTLALQQIDQTPANFSNTTNAVDTWTSCKFGNSTTNNCRFPAAVGVGDGALNLVTAYRGEIASVEGNTPSGYTPFQPGASPSTPNLTSQLLVFGENPLRPNGGLLTRFAGIANALGIDTAVPAAGVYRSPDATTILNSATLDATWAYDPLSDFPVTLNPFSVINSLFAASPSNLQGGVTLKGLNTEAAGLNIGGTLGFLNKYTAFLADVPIQAVANLVQPVAEGQSFYVTALPNDLPILEPLRLPARIINYVFEQLGSTLRLGTPIADALEPAAKILVNIGYSDVVTPTDIATDPATYGGYQPYDRTFLTPGTPQQFLSTSPLTFQEALQVPGDVIKALIGGVTGLIPTGAAAVKSVPAPAAAAASSRRANPPTAALRSAAVSPPARTAGPSRPVAAAARGARDHSRGQ